MYTYLNDYKNRKDLIDSFGNNALMMYALELRYDIDDIYEVASDALTDGGDDKKCDLIYIDKDLGIAIIAQAYWKKNNGQGEAASSNKASDLNTAAAWIFTRSHKDLPESISNAVHELQSALHEGAINQVLFWYVHNCDEKANNLIGEELTTVQASAQKLVNGFLKDTDNTVTVSAAEIGNETIEQWYINSNKRITINDDINVFTNGQGFEVKTEKWQAYVTATTGEWLVGLLRDYKPEKVFSGNPRSFLGAGKRKNKINLGIIETVENQPDNFWAFNNGVTALVNGYEVTGGDIKELKISGITIINGAQTTGAVSQAKSSGKFFVPIRFIKCTDEKIIEDIISNNNKQNGRVSKLAILG